MTATLAAMDPMQHVLLQAIRRVALLLRLALLALVLQDVGATVARAIDATFAARHHRPLCGAHNNRSGVL